MAKKIKSTNKTEPVVSEPTAEPKIDDKFEQARSEIKKILADDSGVGPVKEEKITRVAVESEPESVTEAINKDGKFKEKSAQTANDFVTFYKTDNEKVDMSTIIRKDPGRKKKIIFVIIGILVVLLAASLAGFYFFVHSSDKFNESDVQITPDVPMSISSGDIFSFSLVVANKGSVALEQVSVALQAPTNYVFDSAEPSPTDEAKNTWQVGTIKPNTSKIIKISGAVTGDKGSSVDFGAVVTYRPSNFNSDFSANQLFSMTINDSVLGLDLTMPTKAVSGHAAEYKIKYTNNGTETMSNVRVILSLPNNLTATEYKPAATKDKNVWEFPSLKSNESGTITFSGTLTGDEGGAGEVKVQIGYVDKSGEFHLQNEESSIVFLVNPQLVLTLQLNDSANNNVADFGQKLNYVLKYRNDSQSEIKNLALTAEFTGVVINWDSLVMSVTGTQKDNQITWDGTQIPGLKSVKPGDQGEIQYSFTLKDNIQPAKSTDKNYTLLSKSTASSKDVVDLEGTNLVVESNSISTKLNSKLELRAEGRYYDDQSIPVGHGPLPPVVGQTTTYRVYWYIRNNANEVVNATVKAVVPSNVAWPSDSRVSAGSLSYNATTRTITWSINKIPPQVGQSIAELEASFELQITPLAADVGTTIRLLEKSTIQATDSFTSQELTKNQDFITTDLTGDAQAIGKGTVIQSSETNSNSNANTNI